MLENGRIVSRWSIPTGATARFLPSLRKAARRTSPFVSFACAVALSLVASPLFGQGSLTTSDGLRVGLGVERIGDEPSGQRGRVRAIGDAFGSGVSGAAGDGGQHRAQRIVRERVGQPDVLVVDEQQRGDVGAGHVREDRRGAVDAGVGAGDDEQAQPDAEVERRFRFCRTRPTR